MRKINNIVVWDADETLGSFTTLDNLNNLLENYLDREMTQTELFKLIDLFPEVLRPNIIKILSNLKKKKKKKNLKVVIYTNNNGPNSWIESIKKYLEHKTSKGLFDKVIKAYKIDDNIVEPQRTTHSKTYDDLKRCMNVDDIKNVCFIDDQPHDLFQDNHVSGLHIPPYFTTFTKEDVTSRLLNSDILGKNIDKNYFIWHVKNNYSPEKHFNNDITYSKIDDAILDNHIKSFFKSMNNSQTRRKPKRCNKTRKL